MYYAIKLRDREQAEAVKRDLEAAFPGVDVSLMSEIAKSMSDFRVMYQLIAQVSILALLMGGLGMLKTILMSVLDRTREIGVLRALGWHRRKILEMLLWKSLVLGAVGGMCGITMGLGLGQSVHQVQEGVR